MVIETPRLVLRLPVAEDAQELVRYYLDNHAHLAPWEPQAPPGYFTEAYWRSRADDIQAEARAGSAFRLFVFKRESSARVIGNVSLSQVFRGPLQQATVGYSLAESEQGNGYMTEAVAAVIRYAFDKLRLHRLQAGYMPHNRRSAAVLRRAGFTVEGYARDFLFLAGAWQDHIIAGLVNPDWKQGQS